MSRQFQGKKQDLVNLKAVSSSEVWTKNKSGKVVLRQDLDIYGRIDKGTSAFITSTNLSGKNHKFVKNTDELPNKVKNEIVKMMKNEKRTVVYLVKKQQKK